VRLEHLYRFRFAYPELWSVGGRQNFGLAEGRCEGRISGRLRGANHPRIREDGTYLPDFQGFIETDDGATVLFDYRGRGLLLPDGEFRAVASAIHLSDDERWRHLNDTVCFLEARNDADDNVVADVFELVWEPIAE
jgi:hypothetical protein